VTFDTHPRSSLIVALDFDSLSGALKFARSISDLVGMFKIGNQLFTSAGPEAVKQIAALGNGIFLDLKFHDIPNTVAGAVLSSAAMPGVQLVNVHAMGGSAMLHAAVQAVSAGVPMGADRTRLIAVTILTSMDQKTMRESGISGSPQTSAVKTSPARKKVRSGRSSRFRERSQGHSQSVWPRFSDRHPRSSPFGAVRRENSGRSVPHCHACASNQGRR